MIDAKVIQTLHEIIILTLQSKPIVKLLVCALNILLQAATIRVFLDLFYCIDAASFSFLCALKYI